MKYLVDTNIFLEILLDQEKRTACEEFLGSNKGNLYVSDFSLHSIGVILFRSKNVELFSLFIEDMKDKISVLSLPMSRLNEVAGHKATYQFDFDDAYQYSLAQAFDLKIVTLDNDFKRLNRTEVLFL